ncbi:pyridine nucleotide-disulfide oxidoreductase/dicluster-binding protein [Desulfotalea psychrophila]|uniref:Probable Fe-S oxidoreductase n=1 Tax=Desulfotalea psychrophila (strain LSv54 / DSM 12343) TaxID=177439 RepID=Q6ARM7_DESPS|nr:pyridine nucleotide-disulfide oxidoreductase/dicluster-binding protein [Desulfotalea psychrophila]CAG34998.1 probable Fe-S oxidoreductase [Desulfotalea psychrophila LSv54]
MEQSELREWEAKCVQEEVPRCTAACPLHVDVRSFCSLMGQGRWDKAWTVLAKTLPLPGVLARLCHGPCKNDCIRQGLGGSIAMDSLEEFCAENARAVDPPRPLPARGKVVAVVGAGLTGLCAAWELARRGFAVRLYGEPGKVLALSLPEGVLAAEIKNLARLGVSFHDVSIDQVLLDALLAEADAVFVDSDSLPSELSSWGEADSLTLGTLRPGLFASPCAEDSAIFQAATGRRAANSIVRFTQGVSMVAGRELEGPYQTRLYTNVEDVESVPALIVQASYSDEEIRAEAKRCLQCECMECVKNCEYLKHYKYYPKVYARQAYNNDAIVMGTRQANTMVNSCMLCGLCDTLCPEEFSMADFCLTIRRGMVEKNKMPPAAHEFALRDMAFANGKKCALVRHAPGMVSSEYLFFPGCQLTASNPGAVERAYQDLRDRLGSVGLMLSCCGAPAEWSGRKALMDESMALIREQWQELGSPQIIVSCPTCLTTLRAGIPEAEIISHWTILRALGLPAGARVEAATLAINDPCSARHDPLLQGDVRALLQDLSIEVVEPRLTGKHTECCGYGGLLSDANPDLAKAVAVRRGAAVEEDFVTYCAMCRDMLVKNGKRAMHFYDLIFPSESDPAGRPSPGFSARRENRAHLKEGLLQDLWAEEDTSRVERFSQVQVFFTEEAERIMEERRILKSDMQKVLLQVEESGKAFVHSETGHLLASYRPTLVTYWVEFERLAEGYLVHNTWSHRMRIRGGQA